MQIEWQEWIGLSPAMFLYAVVAIGVAAFIRGYSGFGFSALTVTSLSLILPPAEVIPIAFLPWGFPFFHEPTNLIPFHM